MMLTRCPYCSTTFRVTPEQLKVRQGQVRCGQCRRVFDALRGLDENAAKAPPTPRSPAPAPGEGLSWSIVQPAPPGVDDAYREPVTIAGVDYVPTREAAPVVEPAVKFTPGFRPVSEPIAFETGLEPEASPGRELAFAPAMPTEPATEPELPPAPETAPESPDWGETEFEPLPAPGSAVDIELDVDDYGQTPEPEAKLEFETKLEAETGPATEPGPEAEEHDSRRKSKRNREPLGTPIPARPHSAPARAAASPPTIIELHTPHSLVREPSWPWVLGALIALATIVGQLMLHYRTDIIAERPDTRPLFVSACELFGCEIALPHKIDMIGIDASDLAPDEKRPGTLHLAATLRNRAPYPQAWPHLEITLTDAQERPLLRRALAPAEYLPAGVIATAGFPARGDEAIQLTLTATDVPAVGYRLYVFYP